MPEGVPRRTGMSKICSAISGIPSRIPPPPVSTTPLFNGTVEPGAPDLREHHLADLFGQRLLVVNAQEDASALARGSLAAASACSTRWRADSLTPIQLFPVLATN
ncbi:MAG: hypothetical protein HC872_09405 [Gammaproteobacteria bacterium]|nr:hypothetical protein [Gammaproteobacteria bacterium]